MPSVWHAGCEKGCGGDARICRSSYAELLRALARLRDEDAVLYWHVRERYLRSTKERRALTRQGESYLELRDNQALVGGFVNQAAIDAFDAGRSHFGLRVVGKEKIPGWGVVETWNPKVDLCAECSPKGGCCRVRRGVDRLSALFVGDPFIADEIYWNVAA